MGKVVQAEALGHTLAVGGAPSIAENRVEWREERSRDAPDATGDTVLPST